jgi:predicted nucleic acid-binding protein
MAKSDDIAQLVTKSDAELFAELWRHLKGQGLRPEPSDYGLMAKQALPIWTRLAALK